MATSESARSVDTHELMPSDFYPHPSEGGAYSSSQQSVPTFVDDYVVYFGGAFVIVFFVLIILFLSRKILYTRKVSVMLCLSIPIKA